MVVQFYPENSYRNRISVCMIFQHQEARYIEPRAVQLNEEITQLRAFEPNWPYLREYQYVSSSY